ncbi:MAG: MarR family winged helix-turn-helix transcriptional regulator [Lentimicrobium sp.]
MVSGIQLQVEQPLGRILSALGKGYLQLLRAKLQHLDIDRNYFALVLIESREGVITQQELALLLDTDKVSVVRVVDYLSEKGYVKRVKKPEDRRKHMLFLTEKARLALPLIKQSFHEINCLVLEGFDSSGIAGLNRAIGMIKTNITQNIHTL